MACPLLTVATTFVGSFGRDTGVTLFEELLAVPVPTALTADTVKVYDVPFVNPERIIGIESHVAEIFSGDDVTI